MHAQWGCVGILGLPLEDGPTGPYLEGDPRHKIIIIIIKIKKKKMKKERYQSCVIDKACD